LNAISGRTKSNQAVIFLPNSSPGRWVSLLLVLACTTWTAGWFIIGGDLERMGHTLAATAVGVVASRLLLLEKVIFLIEVE